MRPSSRSQLRFCGALLLFAPVYLLYLGGLFSIGQIYGDDQIVRSIKPTQWFSHLKAAYWDYVIPNITHPYFTTDEAVYKFFLIPIIFLSTSLAAIVVGYKFWKRSSATQQSGMPAMIVPVDDPTPLSSQADREIFFKRGE